MLAEPSITAGVQHFDSLIEAIPVDLLDRKAAGQHLSGLVARLKAPTVIALDGPWGSGKSHFLKLWVTHHRQVADAHVVYFDAFAEDYLDDPLISLVSAIDKVMHDSSEQPAGLAKLKAAAPAIARSLSKAVLNGVTAGLGEHITKFGGGIVGSIADDLTAAVDDFWRLERQKAAALERFREGLTSLAADKGLVLVVDELDRCRPDYALAVLEVAKHAFSVTGVQFILGANLSALESSVRKRYGHDLPAREYLQKFYHFSLGLPASLPEGKAAWEPVFLAACKQLEVPTDYAQKALNQIDYLSFRYPVNLRDVKRIAIRLALLRMPADRRISLEGTLLCCVAIMEILAPELFIAVKNGKVIAPEVKRFLFGDARISDGYSIGTELHIIWKWHLDQELDDGEREVLKRTAGGGLFLARGKEPLSKFVKSRFDLTA